MATNGQAETVTIQINSKGEVEVDKDSFEISKSKHQQVFWKLGVPNARFNVDFGENSPFEYKQFSDVEPYSGLVRREVLGDSKKNYEYTVTVTAASKTIAADPGGHVNP
jgi:hypothetical protein